ncbi:MAG: glucose-1-phosphate thymidylyltransferase RfbA [Chlamydiota bacterium]
MRGILLAGGLGTRLYPMTFPVVKQLLPIYDKPMVYYPLSVLMQAKIREILIISTPQALPQFRALFGDGSRYGLALSYAKQKEPRGIAEALLLGASFIKDETIALILGDNLFYGPKLGSLLMRYAALEAGALVFGYRVQDPRRYGVAAFDEKGHLIDIIEKPTTPPSPYAITGLYFYDNSALEIARALKPSSRKELEITEVNRAYLAAKRLGIHLFDPGFAWLDAGTFEALHQASNYVQAVQERQDIRIGCIEEIAYANGWISAEQLEYLADKQQKSPYGAHLRSLLLSRPAQICNL